ncbi:MAG: Uma2 family endonuclease, partial [Anaerolineae bacterium]
MEATRPDVLSAELGVLIPPGEDELPCDDGVPMETQRHFLQLALLIDSLTLHWDNRDDFFVGGNMFVYYSLEQAEAVIRELEAEEEGKEAPPPEMRAFRGPDFFAVLDVPRHERKSWVIWEEGKGPDVVIELLSASTAKADKGKKKRIYQDQMRVPEYFWYDPFSGEWAGFGLSNGLYEPREPDERGRLISRKLGLALTRWEGEYKDVRARWLRWETLEGVLLPTSQEMAAEEHRRAEEERRRAEEEHRRAEEERRRAEAERQRTEEERRRADELAAELARYR